jgi:hypothetical protein
MENKMFKKLWAMVMKQVVTDGSIEVKVAESLSQLERTGEVKAKVKIAKDIAKMTKAKIEEHGRDLGVELDRRMTKPNMIKDLKSKLK